MDDYNLFLEKHNILSEVQQLIHRNEMISAIKVVKDKTGLSLKECKDIVESISRSHLITKSAYHHTSSISTDDLFQKNQTDEQLNQLLQQHKKLEAIKLVRDTAGMDLSTAKKFVESLQSKKMLFSSELLNDFSNINVNMTNINGKIEIKIKEGSNPERIIYPTDPNWDKVKKMLGNNPELLIYETKFFNRKHPISQKQSTLYVESNSYGKWILFFVLFCIIMLVIYFFYAYP